jgi:hypothetical protein
MSSNKVPLAMGKERSDYKQRMNEYNLRKHYETLRNVKSTLVLTCFPHGARQEH